MTNVKVYNKNLYPSHLVDVFRKNGVLVTSSAKVAKMVSLAS